MARCRAGFTLLELIVVMGVFALVLTVALSFYAWGAHTTQYQTKRMDVYRHTLESVDRVLKAVAGSTLLYVTPSQIVFAPHAVSAPLDRVAWRWPAAAVTVAMVNQQVVWACGGQREVLMVLTPTQTLQFQAVVLPGTGLRPVYQSLEIDTKDVTPRYNDPNTSGAPSFSLQRGILLRTPY